MKKLSLWILCCMSVTLAMTPTGQGPGPSADHLARFMPTGSLFYLESPDFAKLVHDWENSQEKTKWLASDNYQVFSRSRLYQRLDEAQDQFATAAGAPPDMALLDSVAGGQSALALYDVGNLEFLYITRMPAARAMQNVLWSSREKFEPRKAADIPYYVRTEPVKNRLVAFATTGDYMVLATREDLMAAALTRLSGKSAPSLEDEGWYKSLAASAGPMGDLRMMLNIPLLVQSPHFRSYWVQRNVSELKNYSAEVVDVHRGATEIREDRILVKASPPATDSATAANRSALAELVRMVPSQTGIFRAWNSPTADGVLEMLRAKLLAPHTGPGVAPQTAPSVTLTEGQTGSESDLETHIDVPPLQGTEGSFNADALKRLVSAAPLQAALQFQSFRSPDASVFVQPDSAVVVLGSTDWDQEAARAALRAAVEQLWTTSGLGVKWVEHHEGAINYAQLDGLTSLCVAVKGPLLAVSNSSATLKALLTSQSDAPLPPQAIYAAAFAHNVERPGLLKMMRLVEAPIAQQSGAPPGTQGHEPLFFSENLASLSASLERIQSESLVMEDRGANQVETVVYHLKP